MAPGGKEELVADHGAVHNHVLRWSDVGFGVTDPHGKLNWANPALGTLVGVSADQAVGRSLPALLPGAPESPQTGLVLQTTSQDGANHRWLEINCTPLPGGDELLYRIMDITSWRDRELEATQQANALRRAQVLGRMGNWEWDISTDRVLWSDALLDMFGLEPGTELDYAGYLSRVHPGDREMIENALASARATGDRFTYSHRMLVGGPENERVFECFGEIICDEDGTPVRMMGTCHDVTQDRRLQDELRQLAEEDPLTGLPNRRALTRELERHLATGGTGSLLLLDLDNFKDVNDLRGHAVGDRLMRTMAAALRERLDNGQLLGRLGGDEFAVVLPGCEERHAAEVAGRLRDAVADLPLVAGGATTRMTVSTGVAGFSSGAGWEAVLANADLALYASKAAGRNRVTVYDPGHYADTAKRVSVQDRLRKALEHGDLALHAMPIVALSSGRTLGYELLLRLEDGQLPLLGPADFLPAAERSDLVLEIDRWVFGKAIDTLVAHPDPNLRFDVNVSGRTLEDEDFADFVLDRLASSGVAPGRLGFEITETAAVTNLDAARSLAHQVRATGCRIALDDFGAGFGSFVHLKHLPITGIKIDGEFVRGIDSGTRDAVLVSGILEIARGFDLSVVAEWVERPAQVEMLSKLGVSVGQGFHLGKPQPLRSVLKSPDGALSAEDGRSEIH
jgi:diguanylate cyclase (GGDEF)-like protein